MNHFFIVVAIYFLNFVYNVLTFVFLILDVIHNKHTHFYFRYKGYFLLDVLQRFEILNERSSKMKDDYIVSFLIIVVSYFICFYCCRYLIIIRQVKVLWI